MERIRFSIRKLDSSDQWIICAPTAADEGRKAPWGGLGELEVAGLADQGCEDPPRIRVIGGIRLLLLHLFSGVLCHHDSILQMVVMVPELHTTASRLNPTRNPGVPWQELTVPPAPVRPVGRSVEHPGQGIVQTLERTHGTSGPHRYSGYNQRRRRCPNRGLELPQLGNPLRARPDHGQ